MLEITGGGGSANNWAIHKFRECELSGLRVWNAFCNELALSHCGAIKEIITLHKGYMSEIWNIMEEWKNV
jgi:hypothetical protein